MNAMKRAKSEERRAGQAGHMNSISQSEKRWNDEKN